MSTQPADSSIKTWMRLYAKQTFVSGDFGIGLVAGVGAFAAVRHDPDLVHENGVAMLIGAAALGVALLAVVLTAMAILGGISKEYRAVLAQTKRGVRGAFMPYRTVAVVSGLLVITAIAGLVLQAEGNDGTAAVGAALVAALAVWSTWGTVQLTAITAWHSATQARMEADPTPSDIQEYRTTQAVRKKAL